MPGDLIKQYFEELRNFCCSSRIIIMINSKRTRGAVHVGRMGEQEKAYRLLIGKPEGKKPIGRPRCTWEHNIKVDLRDVRLGGTGSIDLAMWEAQ